MASIAGLADELVRALEGAHVADCAPPESPAPEGWLAVPRLVGPARAIATSFPACVGLR